MFFCLCCSYKPPVMRIVCPVAAVISLQQRRDCLHHKANNFSRPWYVAQILRRYLAAFFQCLLKITLNIADTGGAGHICSTLEMVVQASVVKVYGADDGSVIVADKDLCVYEAGGIFVNSNSRGKK